MAAIRIYRRLQELQDVDPNGLPDQGIPIYQTNVSSFVVDTLAAGGAFSLGVSDLGTTLGDTGVTGTRLVLAGIGRITLSQSTDAAGGTITISGGTVGAGAFSAGVDGGNTTGTPAVTGTQVLFAGGNNITLSQSNDGNGGTITISGANTVAQSVQTQNLFDLTLDGNTAGALQLVSSGTLTLAGGNSITLSQNGNAITILGASTSQSVQTQPIQTGISSIVASNATYTSGSVQFTGSGIVTIRSSAGQRVVVDASQSVQTQNMVDVTISGNTAGAGALVSSGTLTLAGGSNITLSQAGNAISIIGNAAGTETQVAISGIGNSETTYTSGTVNLSGLGNVTVRSTTGQAFQISVPAQSVQPETQTFVGGIKNSQTTYTSGTIGLSELGAITIRSTTGNQFQLSVAAQSVQPETQTFVGGIAASDTTYTSGTIRFTGVGGGITVSSNTGQRVDLSVAAQTGTQFSAGLSNIGNTSGDTGTKPGRLILAGGNNITLSGSTNGDSMTITVSGPNIGGAQTGISGIIASDATYTSGTVEFTGSNMITVKSSAGQRVVIDATQSVQSVGMYAVGNTTGQSSSTTRDARSISVDGAGIVSVGYSGGTLRISATQSVQPETQTFIGGVANTETTYTSGTVKLLELGAITVRSTTGNQFQLSVNSQTVQTVGMYALGNTTGQSSSTTRDARSLSVEGAGIVSVGYSAGSLRISATQSVQAETQTFIGGVANTETTYTSGTVKLLELGAITVRSTTGNQFQLSVAAQTVESQSFGMSNIGNTSGTTGIASGGQVRFLLAGGNNITLSQSLNGASGTITISGPNTVAQTNQSLGMYAVQNTTGQSSSTTMDARTLSVAGDGIVSVGYSAGSLRISASQSVQPETQTFIGGIANTETTYTSGTVKLLELGAITVRSTTGNQFQLSVNSQTVESQSIGMSNVGNTSGTTGMASGAQVRMVFAGGNNITLSQSLNGASGTITISGANAGGAQTAISGIVASNTTYTSGTVEFVGSGAVVVGSTTGQKVVITGTDTDVTAIAQTAHGFAVGDWVRLNGTSYVKAQADSEANAEVVGVVSAVADANNFTLTTGGLVTGLSGLTAGSVYYLDPSTAGAITTTEPTTSGQVSKPVFIARTTTSGYVFNMRGNLVPASALTAFLAGMSNIGNTAGDTGITGTRLVLAGGNNITLSQSTNASGGTVTISAFNQTVESQSFGMSNIGNTSGTTGIASGGQVRFLLAGGNNITLSQSLNGASGTITISAPNAVAQTNQSLGMYAVQNTTGQSSSTTLDARTLSIAGDGAVSVGYSAGSLRISAPVQTAESQSIGMSNLGNTSGTTGIASGAQVRMLFAGGNNITLSQSLNGASGTITISAPNAVAQTNQSLGMYAVGNTTGQSSSTTMDARTLSVAGDGAVSVGYSAGSLRVSAPVQTGTQFSAGLSNIGNTSGDTVTVNGRLILAGGNNVTLSGSSNGVSETITISAFNQTVESQSIGMSNIGNTSGTTGIASGGQVRFLFAGGNNITLSQSLNGASGTITISAPNLGAGAMSVGASNLGNTAGSTGVTGTRLVLVGSNAISLSQSTDANGGTITFNDTVSAFQAGVSTGGNTAGDTGVTGTRMVFVGSSPMSLSQATGANGGTITINAPATSSLVGTNGISVSTNGSTISVMQLTVSSLAPYDEAPLVTGQQGQATLHLAPFRAPNMVFDRIAIGMQVSNATNSSGSFTLSHWVGIYTLNASTLSLISSTSISTNFSGSGTAGSYSRYGGPRNLTIPWTMTLTGSDYWMGMNQRTTSGGADVSVSQLLLSKFTNVAWSGIMGAASNASDQRLLGLGVLSISTAGMPASVGIANINGTGSLALRAPVWHLRSGTV